MQKMKVGKRRAVYATTRGQCFYCGLPLAPDAGTTEDVHGHDWLLPQRHQLMATDHKLPAQRGGSDDIDNLAPACSACNNRKGLSSVEEFRLRLSLQSGVMPYRFACEPAPIDRDCIVVVSPAFVRDMIAHNLPDAYGHRSYRGGWRR